MQSIRTRYICPSNSRGSRIQAKCEAKTIYVHYDHSLNIDDNHKAACQALLRAMEWDTSHYPAMYGGSFDGDMYWVFPVDYLETASARPNLREAAKDVIADLELFVSKQGPGPDSRLAKLKAAL